MLRAVYAVSDIIQGDLLKRLEISDYVIFGIWIFSISSDQHSEGPLRITHHFKLFKAKQLQTLLRHTIRSTVFIKTQIDSLKWWVESVDWCHKLRLLLMGRDLLSI